MSKKGLKGVAIGWLGIAVIGGLIWAIPAHAMVILYGIIGAGLLTCLFYKFGKTYER